MTEILHSFRVEDYDLGATLESGQAFRWDPIDGAWNGVIGRRWVRLAQRPGRIEARTCGDPEDWEWLRRYLQIDVDFNGVLASFPDDPPLRSAVQACRGLRLLRQDPWECLASFLLSSTKQILQIREVIRCLCGRFGVPVSMAGYPHPPHAFPPADVLAAASEEALRACGMGFRAPYLRSTARAVADGRVDLVELERLSLDEARERLQSLDGVGPKIADCVLLFAYGFQGAFPVDVWIMRALKELYFAGKRPSPARLLRFSAEHFGVFGGYAQQYLFHYMRLRAGRVAGTAASPASALLADT